MPYLPSRLLSYFIPCISCRFSLESLCNAFQPLFLPQTLLTAPDPPAWLAPFYLTTALADGSSAEPSSFRKGGRGVSDACRRHWERGKAPGLNRFLRSHFENHCTSVVAADTAERVAKQWLISQNTEAGSCHQPLIAGVPTEPQER